MGKKSAAVQQVDAIMAQAGKKKKGAGGKKNRKIGRYSKHPSSMRYKGEQRWIRNRVRRMERHIRRYPNDAQARSILAASR
jgi:hypothetical protein